MERITFICVVLLAGVCAAFVPPAVVQHERPASESGKLGKVSFSVSCEPSVQPQFNSVVAMLHSFWYEKASDTFAAIAQKDPTCGMAYRGIAMTYYHQVWQAPGPADLEAGIAAVEKAKLAGAKTQRERDYIAAIETFYKDADKLDYRTRALAYEKAMDQLQARYPNDHEAAIFYALALLATAPPTDKTHINQKKAGAILEPLFAEQPEHPGIAHYIIHAYDYAPLAARALDAARRYAQIAPDSPHALHMPSHIFTRLGLWQESIDSNLASAASAQKNNAPGNELHAKDLPYLCLSPGGTGSRGEKGARIPPARAPHIRGKSMLPKKRYISSHPCVTRLCKSTTAIGLTRWISRARPPPHGSRWPRASPKTLSPRCVLPLSMRTGPTRTTSPRESSCQLANCLGKCCWN